jgi:hypothetical protein
VNITLWLQAVKVLWVSNGMCEETIFVDYQRKIEEVNTIFVGCVLGVLVDRLSRYDMHIKRQNSCGMN